MMKLSKDVTEQANALLGQNSSDKKDNPASLKAAILLNLLAVWLTLKLAASTTAILLLLSPRWLFVYPGLLFLTIGTLGMASLLPGGLRVSHVVLDIHTLLYCAASVVMGMQLALLGALVRVAGAQSGLLPASPLTDWALSRFRLEIALLVSLALLCASFATVTSTWLMWRDTNFAALDPRLVMRQAIPAVTAGILALDIAAFSFFLTFLQFSHARHTK